MCACSLKLVSVIITLREDIRWKKHPNYGHLQKRDGGGQGGQGPSKRFFCFFSQIWRISILSAWKLKKYRGMSKIRGAGGPIPILTWIHILDAFFIGDNYNGSPTCLRVGARHRGRWPTDKSLNAIQKVLFLKNILI